MKTVIIIFVAFLSALLLASVIYKFMADEPIYPKLELPNFSPEYQIDNQGKG